ncbi:MAG: branched-chain amino acid ABC transporter permease [Planctomycetota bacterium]
MIDLLDWSVLFNAISLGAIYALIAVGYTMVYGIIKLINFAHGEIFMVGTYVAFLLVSGLHLPLGVAMGAGMLACVVLGVVIDFSAYLPLRRRHPLADGLSSAGLGLIALLSLAYFVLKPEGQDTPPGVRFVGFLVVLVPLALFTLAMLGLRGKLGRPKAVVKADRLSALITAIGISLTIQTVAQLTWGPNYHAFPTESLPGFFQREVLTLTGAGGRITRVLGKDVVIWFTTLALMFGLTYLVGSTRIGKAMRACAQDQRTASLMGVSVDWVISVTFMIGSSLAAVAGVLYAVKVGGQINFRMGYYPGVIAFAAAVLGGIGSIKGAVVGGFVIGATQALGQTVASEYDLAFAFGLMILVILFRPWGIFGKAEGEKA